MKKTKTKDAPLAQNKKARHDYQVLETLEAGLVLTGADIKSVRERRINLKDGFAQIHNGEAWLMTVHISEYTQGTRFNHLPLQARKLHLHKKEHQKCTGQTSEKGITLVLLKVYLNHGFAKVLLG